MRAAQMLIRYWCPRTLDCAGRKNAAIARVADLRRHAIDVCARTCRATARSADLVQWTRTQCREVAISCVIHATDADGRITTQSILRLMLVPIGQRARPVGRQVLR